MFIRFNPNPKRKIIDDCVIRAISTVTGKTWEQVNTDLFLIALREGDYQWKNYIWGSYLEKLGFTQHLIPNTCPNCFTVRDFCKLFPEGIYILAIGDHVVAVIDSNYFDTWDSGDEVPVYYWKKENFTT